MTTNLMDEVIGSLRCDVPVEHQDEIARVVMNLTGRAAFVYELTDEEAADLEEANAEIARGGLASDDQVRSLWAKHGL